MALRFTDILIARLNSRVFINVVVGFFLASSLTACSTAQSTQLSLATNNYLNGNYAQAFLDTQKLANDGNAKAQYALGYMYFYGQGTSKDEDIGLVWMRRSAAQGYAPAIQAMNKLTTN